MRIVSCIAWGVLAFGSLGCETKVASKPATGGAQTSSSYLVQSEPADAVPVGEARAKTKDGQEVTLVGLIGGSSKPFIEGWQHSPSLIPKFPIVRRTRAAQHHGTIAVRPKRSRTISLQSRSSTMLASPSAKVRGNF